MAPTGCSKARESAKIVPSSLCPQRAPQQASNVCQIRFLPLRAMLQDRQMSLPHTKSGHPLISHFHPGPWGGWLCACKPFKSCFSNHYSCGSCGCKPHWFSKIDVLGAHLSGTGLKSWGYLMWGSNTSLLRDKLWVLSSLPTVGCCAGGKVYGQVVSQPLLPTLMWAFSCSPHM